MVPVSDGELITIFYNPNPNSVSGAVGTGVFGIYTATEILELASNNALVFNIQSLAWAGSGSPNQYTFNYDGLPLTTGNYISFGTTISNIGGYLQTGTSNLIGSQQIGVENDASPVDNQEGSPLSVWNITSTTPAGTGLFTGSLNAVPNNKSTRTFVTPIGQTIYYGENYYIQSSAFAVDKKLYYWNHKNNTGVGVNTAANDIMSVVFFDSQGKIPNNQNDPVISGGTVPSTNDPTILDKLNRKTILWLLIGAVALIIIFIIGIILLIIIVKMLTKKK